MKIVILFIFKNKKVFLCFRMYFIRYSYFASIHNKIRVCNISFVVNTQTAPNLDTIKQRSS